jgi:hypothetical protein
MPLLEIVLKGHLLVAGGQASDLDVDLSTARRFDGKDWLPYIPATALRGAVRMQLEALLQAAIGSAVDPYPREPLPPPMDAVARLFGYSGPLRQRDGALEGALRFGDALPADPELALHAIGVRPGLELDDETGSASTGRLYFREVAELADQPLVFTAPVTVGNASEEDLSVLRAAIETTDAVGAGKAKGGGAIQMVWHEKGGKPAATRLKGEPATARRARLVVELNEPAHFGDGGRRGNHHATRTYIPGATIRGALAWALLRSGRLTAESPEFRALFLDDSAPVSFGDALLCPGSDVEPAIAPATRRRRRGGDEQLDDILVRELARERVNRRLAARGLYLRADDGDDRFDALPAARPEAGLVRRTRNRVSIDRWQGTAAEGRLFSIEQIEPWLAPLKAGDKTPVLTDGNRRPARFVGIIEGPGGSPPSPIRWLELLAGVQVLMGAGRNHGLGEVKVEVQFEAEPSKDSAIERLHALPRRVEQHAALLAQRMAEGELSQELAPHQTMPVAIVAVSDYLPSGGDISHPLAEPALASGALVDLAPARAFCIPGASGGYDQTPGHAPLKDLLAAVGAGSVFVYELAPKGMAALAALLPALRRGIGLRTASGCGRFVPFHPYPEDQT